MVGISMEFPHADSFFLLYVNLIKCRVVVTAAVGRDDAYAFAATKTLDCFQFFLRKFAEIEFFFHC